jgi:hypothetical protein
VRQQTRMADVPFIFMADESPGLKPGKSFRPGVDQLLTKPFSLIDLQQAVEKALAIRARDAAIRARPRSSSRCPPGPHNIAKFATHVMPPPSESWEMEGLEPALRGSLASFRTVEPAHGHRAGAHVGHGDPARSHRHRSRGHPPGTRDPRAHRRRAGVRGAHAIYEMLQWAKGTFEFEAGEVAATTRSKGRPRSC